VPRSRIVGSERHSIAAPNAPRSREAVESSSVSRKTAKYT